MTLGHRLSTATFDTLTWTAVLVLATQAVLDRRPGCGWRPVWSPVSASTTSTRVAFLLGAILVALPARSGAAAGAADPVAVAGRAHRRADVGPQPALAGRPRLAGLRPVRRHRRRVRRPRRPDRPHRRGGDHVQPGGLRRVGRRAGQAAPAARVASGAPAGGGLRGGAAGLPRRPAARATTWPARSSRWSRPAAPGWPAAAAPAAWSRSAPCSLCRAAVAWPGAGSGAAGVDVRRLVLPAASTTTSPRRSAGPSTPSRCGRSWPTCRTAPWSSPATTARPAPSSGTASARRSTADTTAGGTGGRRRTAPGRSWSCSTTDPAVDFTGCERAATLHNDVGIDNEEEGARRLGLRRPDRLVVRAVGGAVALRRLSGLGHRADARLALHLSPAAPAPRRSGALRYRGP